MLELVLKGNRYYWAWLASLLCLVAAGSAAYLVQFNVGLHSAFYGYLDRQGAGVDYRWVHPDTAP